MKVIRIKPENIIDGRNHGGRALSARETPDRKPKQPGDVFDAPDQWWEARSHWQSLELIEEVEDPPETEGAAENLRDELDLARLELVDAREAYSKADAARGDALASLAHLRAIAGVLVGAVLDAEGIDPDKSLDSQLDAAGAKDLARRLGAGAVDANVRTKALAIDYIEALTR